MDDEGLTEPDDQGAAPSKADRADAGSVGAPVPTETIDKGLDERDDQRSWKPDHGCPDEPRIGVLETGLEQAFVGRVEGLDERLRQRGHRHVCFSFGRVCGSDLERPHALAQRQGLLRLQVARLVVVMVAVEKRWDRGRDRGGDRRALDIRLPTNRGLRAFSFVVEQRVIMSGRNGRAQSSFPPHRLPRPSGGQ